jgi:hypothetical protein
MGREEFVVAFSDTPFSSGPMNDESFNRAGQAVEVGIPGAPFQMREALLQRPYYLGKEIKFYEQKPAKPQRSLDASKYPMLCRLLAGK